MRSNLNIELDQSEIERDRKGLMKICQRDQKKRDTFEENALEELILALELRWRSKVLVRTEHDNHVVQPF